MFDRVTRQRRVRGVTYPLKRVRTRLGRKVITRAQQSRAECRRTVEKSVVQKHASSV